MLGYSEAALRHGERCLKICLEEKIGDFDLAFVHEAVARAYVLMEEKQKAKEQIELAKRAELKIEKEDDRKYFAGELASIKL